MCLRLQAEHVHMALERGAELPADLRAEISMQGSILPVGKTEYIELWDFSPTLPLKIGGMPLPSAIR